MRIFWFKIGEHIATSVLPLAVDLLVSFLRKKIRQYEKETTINN